RPPDGHLAGSSLLAAAEQQLTTVLWSAQMRENLYVRHPEGITGYIRSVVRPGSVVLAHDTGPADRLVTIDHLDAIITGLKADGYELTTVSALCGLTGSTARG
ncbi:MAG: polysaccharide deacetylase family protein, partial [Oryzihumus sp.]